MPINGLQFKKFKCPRNAKIFNFVYDGITAIVPAPGIPFGILVNERRAKCPKYIVGNIVFSRNQINHVFLTTCFFLYEFFYLFVLHKYEIPMYKCMRMILMNTNTLNLKQLNVFWWLEFKYYLLFGILLEIRN